KAEPQAQEPCGVDPFTEKEAGDKGETFARESAKNAYTITVKNTGTETTSQVTVEDTLPEGMVLDPAGTASPGNVPIEAPGWECKPEPGAGGANAGAVKCTNSSPLPQGESYQPITLHVTVEPQAENPSMNKTTVSGGGASQASAAEDETTVTPAVPFGI